jgi:hypothetical protein
MRKHCSNVCKLLPYLDKELKKLGTHAHHRDRSAAAAIFANGTYFLTNPRIKHHPVPDRASSADMAVIPYCYTELMRERGH